MSDSFADRRAAGNAAGGLVRIDIVVVSAAAVVVMMMVVVVMVVVVMMTACADIRGFHGGILYFQFVSHYCFSSPPEPPPAPAGADAARCCRGSWLTFSQSTD